MRVILGLVFLSGVLGACTPSGSYKNREVSRPDTSYGVNTIYIISCEGPSGWKDYRTKRHPYNCYGDKSGVWAFVSVDGKKVWSTNCTVVHKGAPTHP